MCVNSSPQTAGNRADYQLGDRVAVRWASDLPKVELPFHWVNTGDPVPCPHHGIDWQGEGECPHCDQPMQYRQLAEYSPEVAAEIAARPLFDPEKLDEEFFGVQQ